jgi:hypothetical protein
MHFSFKFSVFLTMGILMLAFCSGAHRASAQAVTATINGTVTDPADRAIANADVKVTDLDRGTIWAAKTNGTGFYSLNQLPIGRYEVRVTSSGFEAAVQSPIELQLNQVAAVNIHLAVGSENQTVQVTTEAPLLQSDTTDVGTTIDAATNVALPLASRNYLQLTLLTPGAVTVQPSGFESGQNAGQVTRPEINGNRFDADSFLLDGMDNNDAGSNYVAYSPQPDAIEEFRIITQNAPADFGNYMGGVISASIKSGTNSFHGTAFEFFRNDKLNANQWANKLVPGNVTPRQKMRWNEFGGAAGGPIVKDKLFFFADYQGERFDFPSTTSLISVFTAKERTGDVSELVAAGKNIVDPTTGLPFPKPGSRGDSQLDLLPQADQRPVAKQRNQHHRDQNRFRSGRWPVRLCDERQRPLHGALLLRLSHQPHPELLRSQVQPLRRRHHLELRYRLHAHVVFKPGQRCSSGCELRPGRTEPHHRQLLRKCVLVVQYPRIDHKLPARYELQRRICEWLRYQGQRHRQLRHRHPVL